MAYAPTTWQDDVPPGTGTPLNAANMNHIEQGIAAALPAADASGRLLPTVVNGYWLKGSGGAAVWAPITYADIVGVPPTGIPPTLVDAVGDMIVGSAPDAVMRVGVGSDGQIWTADAASPGGVKWASAPPVTLGPACVLGASATQSLPAGPAWTTLTFDVERSDAAGLHSTGSRITVATAGVYLATGHALSSGGGTPVRILKNGTPVLESTGPALIAAGVACAAGDYLELQIYNSASSTTYNTVLQNDSPHFTVTKVG